MTPTEQDKELREQLLSLYSANFNDGEPIESRVGSRDMFDVSAIVDFIDDFIVPLITADRKRVALEARIDELDTFRIVASIYTTKGGNVQNMKNEIENRLAELKAQQEEV